MHMGGRSHNKRRTMDEY